MTFHQEHQLPTIFDYTQIKSDSSTFKKYFNEISKSLIDKPKKKEIEFLSFQYYLSNFSLFIINKIYLLTCEKIEESIAPKQFIKLFRTLYKGSVDEKIKLYFKLCDFNRDGTVEKNDIWLWLQHFHYMKDMSDTDRNKHNPEQLLTNWITNITDSSFKGKSNYTLQEFTNLIKSNTSDLFVIFDWFFFIFKPFTNENIITFQNEFTNSQINSIENTENSLPLPNVNVVQYFIKYHGVLVSGYKEELNLSDLETVDWDELNAFESDITELKEKCVDKYLFTHTSFPFVNEFLSIKSKQIHPSSNWSVAFGMQDFNSTVGKIEKLKAVTSLKNHTESNWNNAKFCIGKCSIFYKMKMNETNDVEIKNGKAIWVNDNILIYKREMQMLIPLKNVLQIEQDDSISSAYSVAIFYQLLAYPSYLKFVFSTKKHKNDFFSELRVKTKYFEIFDKYTITTLINSGAYGKVYAAHSKEQPDKMLAVKIIPKDFTHTYEQRCLYLWELSINKIIKNSAQPNIAKVYDIYDNLSNSYIVMEYIPISLQGYLAMNQRESCPSLTWIKDIIMQLSSTISFLNTMLGCMHRDIKLENILYDKDTNQIKWIDFGFCEVIGYHETRTERHGTLNYIPPEVIQKKKYDYRIDIWSIGIVAYVMLIGRFPFSPPGRVSTDTHYVATQIWNKNVSLYKNNDSEVYREEYIFKVVDKCLEKNISKRVTINELLTMWRTVNK